MLLWDSEYFGLGIYWFSTSLFILKLLSYFETYRVVALQSYVPSYIKLLSKSA